MPGVFKTGALLLVWGPLSAIGTGFLTVPTTAGELALGPNPVMGSSTVSNPALLPAVPTPVLGLSYGPWLGEVSAMSIAVTAPGWRGPVGVRVRYLGSDDLELRDGRPTDRPLARFGVHGLALDATAAQRFGRLTVGASLRLVNLQIYTASSTGWALDLGVVRPLGEGLVLGAALLNLGRMSPLEVRRPALPQRAIGGLAYRRGGNTLALSGELSSQVRGPIIRLSGETSQSGLTLQTGIQLSRRVVVGSAGFGIGLGIYRLSYGVQIGSQRLGLPQQVAVAVQLP